eukprot:Em0003g748a
MELDENVQPASSRRSYTLSKDVLPPLETLVVTIVGSTELDGELFPAAMLVEERSVANDLLAEADAMIYDLQNQLIFVRQELTEAHETLASQYCNKGGKLDDEPCTDIDNSDSTEANLRVLYPLDRFGIAKNPAVFASGNHTIAVVQADSFVNVNGNPYPIELFLSSDMKFTLLTLGLNGANSIYACPFCTMHRDNRWDMSKAEAHFTNTVVRTLATLRCGFATNGKIAAQHKGSIHRPLTSIPLHHVKLDELHDFEELYTMISSESPPLNAADDIHQKHGSMKQFSCQGVEKHNDDAKRNYFSSNQWDAPAEDRVQAGRAA